MASDGVDKTGVRPSIARLLLRSAADVNAVRSCDGTTALHRASGTKALDIVKILLQHRADALLTDKKQRTAADLAAKLGPRGQELVDIIKEHCNVER